MIDQKDIKKSYILGKPWQKHFETSDKKIVEEYLNAAAIQFYWKEDNSLQTKLVNPAAIQHPITEELVWHNQANVFHYSNYLDTIKYFLERIGIENLPINALYGDYSPISHEDIAEINKLFWREAILFDWQQGDVLMLDNLLIAHGRKPYHGNRLILTAMIS